MFRKLGRIARHIGSKVVHATEGALNKIHHIGRKVHEHAGRIPVIGATVQKGLEAAYTTPLPVVGSAKNMYESARRAVEVGKKVTSDDPAARQEGYSRALRGDMGSTVQRGAEAAQRIANAIS